MALTGGRTELGINWGMSAPTLVDSNVLIDVIGDPTWESWSAAELAGAAASRTVAINPVIYAEVSMGFARIESCESSRCARD